MCPLSSANSVMTIVTEILENKKFMIAHEAWAKQPTIVIRRPSDSIRHNIAQVLIIF